MIKIQEVTKNISKATLLKIIWKMSENIFETERPFYFQVFPFFYKQFIFALRDIKILISGVWKSFSDPEFF